MERIPKPLLAILLLISATSCDLDSMPKTLGKGNKIDFSSFDSSGFNFKINFALSGASRGRANTVYLQGANNSKTGNISTCNLNGTSCACDFFDSAGKTLGTTAQTEISYDERGNYFRCVNSSASTPAKVRIHNQDGTIASPILDIQSSVALGQLIGSELDINRVRAVFRYQCLFNFLQKNGTTSLSFGCSKESISCDPDGTTSKHLCLLNAKFPFYLYADAKDTNFKQKIADKVYNGSTTGKICDMSIKQIDCVGNAAPDDWGTPVKQFGLFAQNTGIWDTAISLVSAPDQTSSSFGFAARTSATTNECPPGLVKRIFYTVKVVTSDLTPSHNFVTDQTATEVRDPSDPPSGFQIGKVSGGSGGFCDDTKCTVPNSTVVAGAKPAMAYSTGTAQPFCVIPGSAIQ